MRPELATRIVQQLINLGHAHAFADGRDKWDESDMRLVKRVVLDSLNLVRQRLLKFLFQRGVHRPAAPLSQLAAACNTTQTEMRRTVNQFLFSDLLEVSAENNEEPFYKLTSGVYNTLERTGLLK